MAMMANNPNDFAFKWHAADGNDATRYATILEQNKARIAELKTELAQLEGASANDLTDMDILDLELASNRANAYDMNGASTALGRIDSRMTNRAKERLDASRAQQNKDYENYLKLSDLQDKYRQLCINFTQAKTPAEAELYKSQLKNIENQINAMNGFPEGGEDIKLKSYASVRDEYWSNTTNTKQGRVFKDDVTPEKRAEIVDGLRAVGLNNEADQLEATPTKGEQDEAKKKEAAKKEKIKKAVKAVTAQMNANKNRVDKEGVQLYKQAEAMADSLFRNYPSYVQLQNHYPIYKAKD
jgi:hypothetical protein